MTSWPVALFGAVALLSSHLLGAQAPPVPTSIRDVAAGQFVAVARTDGSVVGWGRSPGGVVATPTAVDLPGKALRVAGGESTTYALLEDGSVVAWGDNDEGQLGNGASGANRALGSYPKPSLTPVKVTGLGNITAIAAGRKHAMALRRDGTVWAWGWRDNGALGGGDGKPAGSLRVVGALAPVAVPGLAGITQIAAGPTHNLALTSDGHVMAWGANDAGELGVGTRLTGWMPAEVIGLDRVVAVAAGSGGSHGVSGAVRDDGTVWMWGSNASATMGNGQGATAPDDPGGRNLVPIQVKGIVGASTLGIGTGHVAVVLGDGTVRTWGHNGYGQLGIGVSGGYQTRPMKVTGLASVATVYLAGMRSYALRADGTLWIWGFGHNSTTGLTAKNLSVPTRLDLP